MEVKLRSNDPAEGSHIIPYRVELEERKQRNQRPTRPESLKLTIGPTLEPIHSGTAQKSVYRIHSRLYTTEADMFSGLFRYLEDDDGTIRLKGDPLFTFSDGKKALLSNDTKHAFTWPVESPAQLTAHAYDRCRWQALFFADRIMLRMDSDWTQFERAYFTVPGKWISPSGLPHWKAVLTAAGALDKIPEPGSTFTGQAAELNFPDSDWNACFDFRPPQRVTFNGTELKFSIGSLTNDQWTIGFCRPGTLDAWRWK